MSWRDQRGMTLVELLVAMTVTSIVLLGITGVLVVGSHAADLWGQKISEAQTANQLAGWLDQDLHRYVPCSPSGGELDLCLPNAPSKTPSNAAVKYTTSVPGSGCPCNLERTDVQTQARSLVTRALVRSPSFSSKCTSGGGAEIGFVEIDGLQYQPAGQAPAPVATPPPLLLYFRAPLGSCGP
jgi:prepilin-type N-terminal cleavage/methylation domain-containing protein